MLKIKEKVPRRRKIVHFSTYNINVIVSIMLLRLNVTLCIRLKHFLVDGMHLELKQTLRKQKTMTRNLGVNETKFYKLLTKLNFRYSWLCVYTSEMPTG